MISGQIISTTAEADSVARFDRQQMDSLFRFRVQASQHVWTSAPMGNDFSGRWDSSVASGGAITFDSTNNRIQLTTTTANGSTAIRQSFYRAHGEPGQNLIVLLGVASGTPVEGNRKRWGAFTTGNGFFWEQDGSNMELVIRKNGVDTIIPQASWNQDTFDGNGASTFVLNPANVNAYFIEFNYLGSGLVAFGVYTDGYPLLCHRYDAGNILSNSYISTSNLPCRLECTNTTATLASSSFAFYAANIETDYPYVPRGEQRSFRRTTTAPVTAGAYRGLLSIRLKSTNLQSIARILEAGLMTSTNAQGQMVVVRNPTFSGGAHVWTSQPSWACEVDINQTTDITAGEELKSVFISNDNDDIVMPIDGIQLGVNIAGVSDIITIAGVNLAGGTEDYWANITWREY